MASQKPPEMPPGEEWMDNARCKTIATELFFTEDAWVQKAAKKICWVCPVRVECRDYAMRYHPRLLGVWGGTTYRERYNRRRNEQRRQRKNSEGEQERESA